MDKVKKKYGIFTATSLVVGIVIGSGVFKSAGGVLDAAGGKLSTAIFAWLVGGVIMVISAYAFSLVAVRVEKNSGIVDYVEEAAGKKAGYMMAWFMNFAYYPTLIGILAWLGGSISASLFGFTDPYATWYLAAIYLVSTYALSLISPILAGKWQVSATAIKLIPLVLIALVGLISGLFNGTVVENFTTAASNASVGSLAKAVAVTVFAYEGWIIATSINSELKDAKKNLPRALVFGTLVVMGAYLLFFLGLSGVLTNNRAIELSGSLDTSVEAAGLLFGNFFGSAVVVLVLISVLGTLNGLVMGGVRGMYAISVRGKGPKPEVFNKLSKSDATVNSGVLSFVITLLWGVVWFGNFEGWWNGHFMDTSILPIVFLYASYIVVYFSVATKFSDLNVFNRYVVPVVASLGALYLVYGAYTSDTLMFAYFTLIVAVLGVIGALLYRGKKTLSKEKL
jgi:APA family basic amino acid/polyamine antiporter